MFKQSLLFCFCVIFTFQLTWADQVGPDGSQFADEINEFVEVCKEQTTCLERYQSELIYSLNEQINKIGFSNSETLKKISFEQAQIWGDTILEGDYVADGKTRLDRALAIFKGGQLVGYQIHYSEKAWYTGNCLYNGQEESLGDCDPGRINETSYVSPDFLTYFVDEQGATFAFDQD